MLVYVNNKISHIPFETWRVIRLSSKNNFELHNSQYSLKTIAVTPQVVCKENLRMTVSSCDLKITTGLGSFFHENENKYSQSRHSQVKLSLNKYL